MTHSTAQPQPATGQDEVPEPLYPSVQDWVTQQFLPMYRRPLGGEWRWCGQWWRHAEAIMRLTALWQSWEAMRLQPGTGTANWLRDHLDHQLPVLLGRSGPFAQCSEDEHIDPRIAGADLWPPGWWDISGDDASADNGTAGTRPQPVLPADPEPDGGIPEEQP